jgi:hypothetical protein
MPHFLIFYFYTLHGPLRDFSHDALPSSSKGRNINPKTWPLEYPSLPGLRNNSRRELPRLQKVRIPLEI